MTPSMGSWLPFLGEIVILVLTCCAANRSYRLATASFALIASSLALFTHATLLWVCPGCGIVSLLPAGPLVVPGCAILLQLQMVYLVAT